MDACFAWGNGILRSNVIPTWQRPENFSFSTFTVRFKPYVFSTLSKWIAMSEKNIYIFSKNKNWYRWLFCEKKNQKNETYWSGAIVFRFPTTWMRKSGELCSKSSSTINSKTSFCINVCRTFSSTRVSLGLTARSEILIEEIRGIPLPKEKDDIWRESKQKKWVKNNPNGAVLSCPEGRVPKKTGLQLLRIGFKTPLSMLAISGSEKRILKIPNQLLA